MHITLIAAQDVKILLAVVIAAIAGGNPLPTVAKDRGCAVVLLLSELLAHGYLLRDSPTEIRIACLLTQRMLCPP